MTAYREIEPSWSWIATCIGVALALLVICFLVSTIWAPILEVSVMTFSTVGALLLLMATWSSIKTREHILLLNLSQERVGDFEEGLNSMGREINRNAFDDLRREWHLNILGVICLFLAVGSFALHTASTHDWI